VALTVGTDSYITVADATTWFGGRLGEVNWGAASADQKEDALRMACVRLERLHYQGEPGSSAQTLRWPRSGLVDQHSTELSSSAVPQFVKDAQCEEALYLLDWLLDHTFGRAGALTRQREGIRAAKVGDVQEQYRPEGAPDALRSALGPRALEYLRPYLARYPPGGVFTL